MAESALTGEPLYMPAPPPTPYKAPAPSVTRYKSVRSSDVGEESAAGGFKTACDNEADAASKASRSAWCLSGWLPEGRKRAVPAVHTGLIWLDIDNVADEAAANAMSDKIWAADFNKHLWIVGRSASKKGIRVIAYFGHHSGGDTRRWHKQRWAHLAATVGKRLELPTSEKSKAGGAFIDKAAGCAVNAVTYTVHVDHDHKPKAWQADFSAPGSKSKFPTKRRGKLPNWPEKTWRQMLSHLISDDLSYEDYCGVVRGLACLLGPEAALTVAKEWNAESYSGDERKSDEHLTALIRSYDTDREGGQTRLTLRYIAEQHGYKHQERTPSASKRLSRSPEGLRQGLAGIGVRTRLNVLLHDDEFSELDSTVWERPDAHRRAGIRNRLNARYDWGKTETPQVNISEYVFRDLLYVLNDQQRVHPLLDWFDALPEWDRVERVGNLLSDLYLCELEASDNNVAMARIGSRSIIYGIVGRTLNPGCKHDETVILVGQQGMAKSTLCHHLLPPALGLSGHQIIHDDPKKMVESQLGKVVLEMPEMAGMRKVDINNLNMHQTKTHDAGIRLAFRKDPYDIPRRHITIGTTNSYVPLPADVGHRRWLPVFLDTAKKGTNTPGVYARVVGYLSENREQLFAEALLKYKHDGVRAYDGTPDAVAVKEATWERAKPRLAEHDRLDELDDVPVWEVDETGWTLQGIQARLKVDDRDKHPTLHAVQRLVTSRGWRRGYNTSYVSGKRRRQRAWWAPNPDSA